MSRPPESLREEFKGFGAPKRLGAHLYVVTIPNSSSGGVRIVEYFGFAGDTEGISDDPEHTFELERAVVDRKIWTKISEPLRSEFNARLKANKMAPSRFTVGDNYLEKLLGRELCVLAWASEHVTESGAEITDRLGVIVARWRSLRPEERWWLFSMTAAEAGGSGDSDRGWRKALYYALSDGAGSRMPRRRLTRSETQQKLFGPNTFAGGLFDFAEGDTKSDGTANDR